MIELAGDKKLSSDLGFGAIVGQEGLKEALLAAATDDALSGLLIQGEKGTAKSTAVRGLADLLPEQRAVADCPFGCPPDDPARQCANCRERADPPVECRPVPLVTVPLAATRERVVGSLSVAGALAGEPEFDPGLLARANRGILYVDEVNLLDDHLVDVLLDAAASGVNRVERDGVSLSHPAEFTLVGTMNPEEGDLRPQLRDRFALRVGVEGSDDLGERVAIIDRALGEGNTESDTTDAADLRDRLLGARARLEGVELPAGIKREIAELCRDAGVEGHRADVATARAARALAALDGRERVREPDVRRAAELALPHRLRSRPFEDAPEPEEVLEDHFDDEDEADGDQESGDDDTERDAEMDGAPEDGGGESGDHGDASSETDGEAGPDGDGTEPGRDDGDGTGDSGTSEPAGVSGDSDGEDGSEPEGDNDEEATPLLPGQTPAGIGEAAAPEVEPEADAGGTGGSHAGAPTAAGGGSRVRTERAGPGDAVDAAASVRAAAGRGADAVESRDLRRSVRTGGDSALVVFALDASASMRGPMRAAKGVVMELLREVYEGRDEVSVVAFAGEGGEVLLPPTDSVSMAARHLKELPTADRTPLPAGLRTTGEVLSRADPAAGVVVLVTDGRANAGDGSPTAETRSAARELAELDAHVVVVDAAPDDRTGLAPEIVRLTDGERVPLSALSAEAVDRAVANARGEP